MPKLTDVQARNLKPGDKKIADGTVTGLYLCPSRGAGQGKWILIFMSPVTRTRREMGLGTYPEVNIRDARDSAQAARKYVRDGKDPIQQRDLEQAERQTSHMVPTFEEAARSVHKEQKPGWSNSKAAAQWLTTLETYVFPQLGRSKVDALKAKDFADALRPIWNTKQETAKRVKQRCSVVMDWCVAREFIQASPVSVVDKLLAKQQSKSGRVKHFPSLPWKDIPDFVERVIKNGKTSMAKPMLEFLILTAARSGEVRGMTWDEVDFGNQVWAIPAERMKAKTAHNVPLSPRAIEILEEQGAAGLHDTLVFPSPRGKKFSDMVLTKLLRDNKAPSDQPGRTATAHGFRSSFRDWASEHGYQRDLAERALAHTIKNQTESAYHRTDLLEQRRGMMEAWADQVLGKTRSGKVIPLRKGA